MENNTNTFIVTRDGEIDPEFKRKQQIEAIQAGLGHVVELVTAPMVEIAQNVATNVKRELSVSFYDIIHGTDFKEQMHKQREARELERARKRFGLTG